MKKSALLVHLISSIFWFCSPMTVGATPIPTVQAELEINGELIELVNVVQWQHINLEHLTANSSSIIQLPDGTVLSWKSGKNLQQILKDAGLLHEFEQSFQSQLTNIPSPTVGWARIDFVYGSAETQRNNTISGSYNEGFQVDCDESCAYIELDDLENTGRSVRGNFEGQQWINGLYQDVDGGWGCLKWVNGGREPTGRHPYGDNFKVVVTKTDESTDLVETSLYFRVCNFCGCTPYYIGPFQFLSYHVGDWIFMGVH